MKPDIREAARDLVRRQIAERQAAGFPPIVDDERRQARIREKLERSHHLQRMRRAERAAAQLREEASRLGTEVIERAMEKAGRRDGR